MQTVEPRATIQGTKGLSAAAAAAVVATMRTGVLTFNQPDINRQRQHNAHGWRGTGRPVKPVPLPAFLHLEKGACIAATPDVMRFIHASFMTPADLSK